MKKLIDPTDDELNAAFASEVCGWHLGSGKQEYPGYWYTKTGEVESLSKFPPRFTDSADLVLPHLEKAGWRGTGNRAGDTCMAAVSVNNKACTEEFGAQQDWTHTQTPFPRASVIALLRAHGVEIEFTK